MNDHLWKVYGFAEEFVFSVIDQVIFPWYQARTGKHNSHKLMRSMVAERVAKDLSMNLWIPKFLENETLDEVPEAFIPKLRISDVFSQALGNGDYELMVTLYTLGNTENTQVVTLHELLTGFTPLSPMEYQDYDA